MEPPEAMCAAAAPELEGRPSASAPEPEAPGPGSSDEEVCFVGDGTSLSGGVDAVAIFMVAKDGVDGDMVSYRTLATMLTEGKVRQSLPVFGG